VENGRMALTVLWKGSTLDPAADPQSGEPKQ
jgi:hypothetical protein